MWCTRMLQRHKAVSAGLKRKTLLNFEYLLSVGLKLLTALRAWGKTEKDRQ